MFLATLGQGWQKTGWRVHAWCLLQETTMTLKWIADRLKMGTWTHVTNRLYHLKN
jgi:hypothetical protein